MLPHRLAEIPKNEPLVVCCDAGYKGSLVASILAQNRYHDITNVLLGNAGVGACGISY